MNDRGAILLLTVMIVGAIAAAIVSTLLISGIDTTIIGGEEDQGTTAKALADGCAEEALLVLRNTPGFTGSNTVTLDGNECSYDIIAAGSDRTVNAEATYNGNTRRVQVEVDQFTPQIIPSSWQEVDSF